MKTLIQALSITAVAFSLTATPGTAADFLISDFNNTLYDFTPGSSGAVNPRSINVLGNGSILDIDFSADGTLFGLTTFNDNSLYTINPSTGNATLTALPAIMQYSFSPCFSPSIGFSFEDGCTS